MNWPPTALSWDISSKNSFWSISHFLRMGFLCLLDYIFKNYCLNWIWHLTNLFLCGGGRKGYCCPLSYLSDRCILSWKKIPPTWTCLLDLENIDKPWELAVCKGRSVEYGTCKVRGTKPASLGSLHREFHTMSHFKAVMEGKVAWWHGHNTIPCWQGGLYILCSLIK